MALTGKGHLTDKIIEEVLGKENVEIHFVSEELPKHPNGMIFKVYQDDKLLDSITAVSYTHLPITIKTNDDLQEASEVLIALGYRKVEVDKALKVLADENLDTNGYVKRALSLLVK